MLMTMKVRDRVKSDQKAIEIKAVLPRVFSLVNFAPGLLDLRALGLWPVNGLNVHWKGHGSQVHQDHSSLARC